MQSRWRLILLLAAPALIKAGELPEVTVVAPRPVTPEQTAGDSVPTFVRSHGNPSFRTGQLSRWETAICAEGMGLSQDFNDFVTARVQTVAAAVYAQEPAKAPCKPNVFVIFTTLPQQLMDNVATKQSSIADIMMREFKNP